MAWALTIPLTAAAAYFTALSVRHHHQIFSGLLVTLPYLAVFYAVEISDLKFEFRRHGARLVIAEIPLVLAVFYLTPVSLLIIRLVSNAAVLLSRRLSPVKAIFNLANLACYVALTSYIVSSQQPFDPAAPRSWAIIFGAIMAGLAINVCATLGVIMLVQAPMSLQALASAAGPSLIGGAVNVVIGLVVLIAVQSSPYTMILICVVAIALAFVYRGYARSLRQHRRLTEIYDFTRSVSESPYDGTLSDVLLKGVRNLLRAESATLWLPASGRYPETTLTARADVKGLLDTAPTPAYFRRQAVATGAIVAVGTKLGTEELRRELRTTDLRDVIVVPLRSGGAVIGTLEVCGRLVAAGTFTADDVRLAETLAAHASVAVENNRLVDRLRFDAYHDALTGLPNRRRMLDALEEAVKVQAPGEIVAVMIFDSDNLRDVNESLGHAAGDKMLIEFADRLRDLCPPAALVGRVGGDGFGVTIRLESADAALVLANEIRDALSHIMELGPLHLDVGAAVGIAVYPDHGSDPAVLLQHADVATRAAKSMATKVVLFDPSLESRTVRRLGLAADLRRALDADALEVYFQPKVAIATRELVGIECLARWEHPVHGRVAPADFIAVAEHTGQLGRLTEFVLREGLARAVELQAAGHELPISVNLSPRIATDIDFRIRLVALLATTSIDPRMLTLEITEDGMLAEHDRPLPALHRLHELGVRLSVDDFGTGYSSLSYLRKLPVDEVKIDHAFVQGMATDPGDRAIVRTVVDLARHLGLTVVAEGVESELTLSLLAEMGCDVGQGFLFSRPLPFDRLQSWIAARTDPDTTSETGGRRLRAV